MAATFAQGRPLLRGREVPPALSSLFLHLFCSPPGLCPCPGAMEPTASDLRLVPGAAQDVWLQMPCAAGRPLHSRGHQHHPRHPGSPCGQWPWAPAWVHTPGDWRKDAWESLQGVPEQRVERTGHGGHPEQGRGAAWMLHLAPGWALGAWASW